jgi:hypothetical protein
MVNYFFFKGFLLPLKKINSLYKDLFFIKSTQENTEGFDRGVSSSKKEKSKNFLAIGFFEPLEEQMVTWIQRFFNLYGYQEVHDCLLTLKFLKLIRVVKPTAIKNYKLNYDTTSRDTQLENIVDGFFYMMHSITDKIIEDINVDSFLLADLIYTNFVYKIYSGSELEVEEFYEDVNRIIENILSKKRDSKHTGKRVSTEILNLRKKTLRFSKKISMKDNLEIEKKIADTLKGSQDVKRNYLKLRENIQYRYCIFKKKIIDMKINSRNYADIYEEEFNSEESLIANDEEQELLSQGGSFERTGKKIPKSETIKKEQKAHMILDDEQNAESKLIF